jgi:hypothetical protein
MALPLIFAAVSAGAQLVSGLSQKRAADNAANASREAAEFNAKIIERDIGLLERQRAIINAQFGIDDFRMRKQFEETVQGTVRASTGYAGFDMSQGTPLAVLRSNARELEYQSAINTFNNEVVNLQISDAQEESRLSARLSRMEGGAQAASLRAQGTTSLIRSIGAGAGRAYETGLFR